MESVQQRPLDMRTRRTAPRSGSYVAAILWAAVVAILLGLVSVTVAQAAGGASAPKKSLRPLLRNYPLNPGAGRIEAPPVKPTPVVSTAPNPETTPPRSDAGGTSSVARASAVVGAAALLAALVALLVIQSRRAPPLSPEGAQMAGFLRKNRKHLSDDGSPEGPEAPVPDASGEVETLNASSPAGSDRLAEPVAAVLQAADDAAARLTEAMRQEAEDIRRQAELEASARIEEARLEAESLRSTAEQARAEALASSDQTRAAAEAYAEERRLAAEREATQILKKAEGDAVSRRDALIKHSALLQKDAALAENRLRLLVGGLREVADRLDDLVGRTTQERAGAQTAERHDAASEGAGADDDPAEASLTDTLQRKPARAGMS